MLPAAIADELKPFLAGDEPEHTFPVHGGDINQAAGIELKSGKRHFLKWNVSAPEGMFETEAKGLELLAAAGSELRIPKTLYFAPHLLLLEWVPSHTGGHHARASREFGEALARLHSVSDDSFGLHFNNYIGQLPQSNKRHKNWADFFVLERIEPQLKLAVDESKLPAAIARQAEIMYNKLGGIFPEEPPALLHGDLWSGNYMFTAQGQPCIYDPAVYFGHREMELAMTRLFGGFSPGFYKAYESVMPPEPGFNERIELYQLYPVLMHANLFDGHYCEQATKIIRRFA